MPHSDALNPKAGLTIECWVRCSSSSEWQNIVGKWSVATNDCSYCLQKGPGGRFKFYLTESNTDRFGLAELTGARKVTTDAWTHVAATFDGSFARIYLGGLLDTTQNVGTERAIRPSMTSLLIGAGNQFSGLIDELSLYSRALSEAEIQAIHRAGAAGKIKPKSTTITYPTSIGKRLDDPAADARKLLERKAALAEAKWNQLWHERRTTLGRLHYQTIDAENLLGESLRKQGNYEEAERHLLDSYNLVPQAERFPSNWIPIYQQRLVQLYQAWNKLDEAEKWRQLLAVKRGQK